MKRTRWLLTTGITIAAALTAIGCSSQTASSDAVAPGAAPGATKTATKPSGSSAGSFFSRPKPITLPEGTVLKVRTTNSLSTKVNHSGEAFVASLEEPLLADNRVVAPKGATVNGIIAESDPGGRVEGRARLAVRLASVETADGKTLELSTNTIAREARGTKTKDATKIGIGSGVGAAIGAIAGGGRGAAIGAAAGAGAGTGLVLATRGDPAVLPGESVLAFRLTAPLTVHVK